MTSPRAVGRATWRGDETGVGVVGSLFGVLAFLTFVLFVVQVVLYLFTASVVQTAAIDGASRGAAVPGDVAGAARERVLAVLGGAGDDAEVTTVVSTDASGRVLRVTVAVPPPSAVVAGLGVARVTRSAEARIEE